MIGGAMIAEGGFGCVFHPAIPCSHDEGDEDEFISKIVKRDFNSDNEIQIADKIRKINKWRSYFNVVTNSCATEISEIDAKEREKCESFKKYPEKEFIILRMPYIKGRPLAIHLSDESLNDTKRQRENLQGYIFLLEGINKLIGANIVHNDLKSGNILFDTVVLENTYELSNAMSYYATSDQKIGLLFAESIELASSDIESYINTDNSINTKISPIVHFLFSFSLLQLQVSWNPIPRKTTPITNANTPIKQQNSFFFFKLFAHSTTLW